MRGNEATAFHIWYLQIQLDHDGLVFAIHPQISLSLSRQLILYICMPQLPTFVILSDPNIVLNTFNFTIIHFAYSLHKVTVTSHYLFGSIISTQHPQPLYIQFVSQNQPCSNPSTQRPTPMQQPTTTHAHTQTHTDLTHCQPFLYPLSPLQFLILLQNQHLLAQPQSHLLQPELPLIANTEQQSNSGVKSQTRTAGIDFSKNTSQVENKPTKHWQTRAELTHLSRTDLLPVTNASELEAELTRAGNEGEEFQQDEPDEHVSLKCALKLTNFLSDYFPNYSLNRVVQALDSYYKENPRGASPQVVLQAQQEQALDIDNDIFSTDLLEYSYLKPSMLPPLASTKHIRYGVNGCKYYDMVITRAEERTKQDELKFLQQRFVAHVFCNKGYGLQHYRAAIGQTLYEFNKDRYKSLVGTTVRLAFRKVEQFLQQKMKRNISALKRVQVKALMTPLLNIHTQFEPRVRDSFIRCIRTTFCLETEPVLDTEVLLFYKQLVVKTRGPNYVQIVDRRLSSDQLKKLQTKLYQANVLWTPALEREFIEVYLKRLSLSGIKEQFQRKYCPEIDNKHFQHSRLRARCDKIFTSCLRKVNFLLDTAGRSKELVAMTDRLKKVVSRSPVARKIRHDLCQIFLGKDITIQFVAKVAAKIKKMIAENRNLFGNNTAHSEDTSKCKIQENSNPVSQEASNNISNPAKTNKQRRRLKYQIQKENVKLEQEESIFSSEELGSNQYQLKMQQEPNKLTPEDKQDEQQSTQKAQNIFYSQSSQDEQEEQSTGLNQKVTRGRPKKRLKRPVKKQESDDSFEQIQRIIQQQQKVMKQNRRDRE